MATKEVRMQRCPSRRPRRTSRLVAVQAALSALAVLTPALAAADWVELGPEGGAIRALAMAPSDPSTVYAGTSGNGVFRSRDRGASWSVAHGGMGRATVSALAVDPHDPLRVFAGTADGRVFATDDGGTTWTSPFAGAPFPAGKPIAALAIDGAQPPTVWAAAGVYVLRTADLGRTWSASAPPTPAPDIDAVLSLAVNPARPAEVWAGMWQGLFKSTDSGATWTPAQYQGHAFARAAGIGLDPTAPSTVLVGSGCPWCGESSFPFFLVMRSEDSGLTWTQSYLPSGGGDGPPLTLAIDPRDARHVVAAVPWGVLVSRDGGATWPPGEPQRWGVSAAVFDPAEPERILAATGAGVLVSADGGLHWTPSVRGLGAAALGALAVTGGADQRVLAGGGDAGILAFDPSSGAWAASGEGLPVADMASCCPAVATLVVDPQRRETVYAAWAGVFKSADGGRRWAPARNGLEEGERSPGNFYSPLAMAIDPASPTTLYAVTERGVAKTTDGAATWMDANAGLPDWPDLWALALDPVHPTSLMAGGAKTYRSVDGGEHWQEAVAPSAGASVWALAADPRGGRFYASTWRGPGGLYRTDDLGLTWQRLPVPAEVGCFTYGDGSTSCPYVATIAFDPTAPGTVYLGTPSGVWRGVDDGLTWSPVGAATAGLWINAITFDPNSRTIYAASSGAGLLALRTLRARRHLDRAAPLPGVRSLVLRAR